MIYQELERKNRIALSIALRFLLTRSFYRGGFMHAPCVIWIQYFVHPPGLESYLNKWVLKPELARVYSTNAVQGCLHTDSCPLICLFCSLRSKRYYMSLAKWVPSHFSPGTMRYMNSIFCPSTWTRTRDHACIRRRLYQLSYGWLGGETIAYLQSRDKQAPPVREGRVWKLRSFGWGLAACVSMDSFHRVFVCVNCPKEMTHPDTPKYVTIVHGDLLSAISVVHT